MNQAGLGHVALVAWTIFEANGADQFARRQFHYMRFMIAPGYGLWIERHLPKRLAGVAATTAAGGSAGAAKGIMAPALSLNITQFYYGLSMTILR